MKYIHQTCGGLIDTKTRTCTKCHKKWTWLAWWMTATEIRPIPEPSKKAKGVTYRKGTGVKPTRMQYAEWGNKIPGVGAIASRLPNWPRWARILVTVVVAGLVIFLLWQFL